MEIIRILPLCVTFQFAMSMYARPFRNIVGEAQTSPEMSYEDVANHQFPTGYSSSDENIRRYPVYSEIVPDYGTIETEKQLSRQSGQHLLDQIIKDRVSTLQRFHYDFNKLLEDIENTAMSFISKKSFFGGLSRRSLFDISNIDSVRTINTGVFQVGSDMKNIFKNMITDINAFIYYISHHRSFGLEDVFSGAFSGLLRIFS